MSPPQARARNQAAEPSEAVRPSIEDIEVDLLIDAILATYGYDFRGYVRASLRRRLGQAMKSLGCATLSELQGRLLRSEAVFLALMPFLTIRTTEMFRDPPFFASLRETVVSYLRTYPSLKLWVAGCSTGQEVLSLCILLLEAGLLDRTLIYATDVNQRSLEQACRGVYPIDEMAAATRNYYRSGGSRTLVEYFSAAYGSALFDPRLLRNVIYTEHSLATDAVFAEVHLVTCRNVLIYFGRDLQDRAIGLFRDALCHRGFLCLGSKETLRFSRHRTAFVNVVPEQRIYQKC